LTKGCQSLKVLPSFIAIGLVPPRQIALRPTAIFRRTRTRATGTNWVGLLGISIQYSFNSDFVFPIIPNIVDVGKPVIPVKSEAAQWNIRTGRMQFPRSIVDGANIKLKQMNAVPANRNLKGTMQLTQGDGRGNQDASPDHRADSQKVDFQLEGFGCRMHPKFLPASSSKRNCPTLWGTLVMYF
jgi:hypothetical protein